MFAAAADGDTAALSWLVSHKGAQVNEPLAGQHVLQVSIDRRLSSLSRPLWGRWRSAISTTKRPELWWETSELWCPLKSRRPIAG